MKTDLQLQTEVMEKIESDLRLNGSKISAEVINGIVTLKGNVDNYIKKLAVEDAAKRVKEVHGIADEISVNLLQDDKRNDGDLAYAAVNALIRESKENIKVIVDHGWITLEGNVCWPFQKDAAANVISDLAGLKGLTNHININPFLNFA